MRGESPEHECRQGRDSCKGRIRDGEGKWHSAGVERPDSLCRACEDSAFADIRELANDYALLEIFRLVVPSAVSGPKVSGSSEPSIPIALGIDTLMTEMVEESARWARRLPGQGDELTVICSSLGTLVDLPPKVMVMWRPHPDGGDDTTTKVLDGVDGVLALSALHHRTIQVLGLEAPTESWLKESCHVCGRQQVFSSLSEALIRCRGCRNVWDQDEFMRLNNPFLAAA